MISDKKTVHHANNPNIMIKNASEDDIPLILSFIKQLADYECLSGEVITTQESLHNALFGSPKLAEAVIGYYDAEPAAYAVFFERFYSFLGKSGLYLDNIYVKPEYRNRGIGSAIISHLAELAKKRNCPRIEWWVLNWNKTAIKFYNKFNIMSMDEWTVCRISENDINDIVTPDK